jgi:hypothetical protein
LHTVLEIFGTHLFSQPGQRCDGTVHRCHYTLPSALCKLHHTSASTSPGEKQCTAKHNHAHKHAHSRTHTMASSRRRTKYIHMFSELHATVTHFQRQSQPICEQGNGGRCTPQWPRVRHLSSLQSHRRIHLP